MRSSHNRFIAHLVTSNPYVAIPAIEEEISQEIIALEANQILNNKYECYDIKERIIDLKMLLSVLRSELRS
jgi:hypothetical protein